MKLLVAAHTGPHIRAVMRSAVVILSMVAAIAAEAPYHLQRPAAQAPSFNYPSAPVPPPSPPPHPHSHPHPPPRPQPIPQFIQYPSQPVPAPQLFSQSSGYHYQQPNIAPAFVQPAPQPQIHALPAPQPLPIISYPQLQYAQPLPQPIPQAPPSYSYAIPQPQIAPAPRPQPAPAPIQPRPAYIAPQPQQAPQPANIAPQPQPAPLPAYAAPHSHPAPQPAVHYQPQVTSQQGYAYQQPQIQYISQLPLQAQPLQAQPLANNNGASSALSSYQADSNQYSNLNSQSHSHVQLHGEALDSTVVDHVQNIIKENEHSSARNAGYLSLVSGVSLEHARPSIEISSFVHNSPLQTAQNSGHTSVEQLSSSQSSSAAAAASAVSLDYGLPTITANAQVASQPDSSIAFLPQNKPATSYGSPQ